MRLCISIYAWLGGGTSEKSPQIYHKKSNEPQEFHFGGGKRGHGRGTFSMAFIILNSAFPLAVIGSGDREIKGNEFMQTSLGREIMR